MTAYDYQRQTWIEGPEARELRIRQLTQERDLILSDRGDDYLRFINCPDGPEAAVASIEARLAELA